MTETTQAIKINDTIIDYLTGHGFNRWSKGNLDRLYINASQLGLVCRYYNTGNISGAEFNGETISNCQARRYKAAKTFVDVKTGTVHSDYPALLEAAEKLLVEAQEGGK